MSTNHEFPEHQVNEWKSKWRRVFKTVIDGEVFVWRQLRRKEFVELTNTYSDTQNGGTFELQDRIVKTAMLYPENIAEVIESSAGLSSILSEEIVSKSGFDVDKETQEM